MGKLTPLQQFSLLMAATLVAGTVILAGLLSWLMRRHLEDETIALTRREVEVHFNDIFQTNVFVRPLTDAEAARFDPTVRLHFGIYDIVQLRLYRTDGTMIYNYLPGLRPVPDAPAPTGAADVGADHLGHVEQAASGTLVVERTQLAPQDNIAKQALSDVLEVYVPIHRDGQVVGVAEVYRNIQQQVGEERRLELLAAAGVTVGSVMLFISLLGIFRDSTRRIRRQSEALSRSNSDLQATHAATLEALVTALDARDHETQGHSERVTRYAGVIGGALGLDQDQLTALERGALLHDIGKIGVPDGILLKPGPLSEVEWQRMRQHPELGASMVSAISFLALAVPVVRHHHERFDGTGYPDRLGAADIPLAARVFSVADTFDAMTSDRPYREALSLGDARSEIERGAGKQFDPVVVEAFLTIPELTLAEIRRRTINDAARGEKVISLGLFPNGRVAV